jgi:hypothetical protein
MESVDYGWGITRGGATLRIDKLVTGYPTWNFARLFVEGLLGMISELLSGFKKINLFSHSHQKEGIVAMHAVVRETRYAPDKSKGRCTLRKPHSHDRVGP